jgi:hypothetical protein
VIRALTGSQCSVDVLGQITTWISEHEALFSGMAAIVALIAIVPAGLRQFLRRRKASGKQGESTESVTAAEKRKQDATGNPRLAVFPNSGHRQKR